MKLLVVTALVAVAAAPFVLPPSWLTLGTYVSLGALVALGLVLITGIGGMTSFGQAAFVGVGAYLSGYMTTALNVSPWLTLPVALATTALLAWALGALTLRLSGHYLPIGTIAWGLSLFYLFANVPALGGFNGISGIPHLRIATSSLADRGMFWAAALALALALVSAGWLLDSRIGRAVRSLRGAAAMAEGFGVNTFRLKTALFIHAALLAALSGWLYAHFLRFIDPTSFGLRQSIEYLFMAVIGGAASIWGALLGSAVFTVLHQMVRDILPVLTGKTGHYETLVYGVTMVIVFLYARKGLVPLFARWMPPRSARAPAAAVSLPRRPRPERGETLLEVEGLHKTFGGLVAVNRLSFQVRAGEIVGLIGPNGAGKSTVFNLITGLTSASAGRVSFRGRPIVGLPSRRICALGIARTFQHVRIRPQMSLIENVAIGAHLRGRRGYLSSLVRLDRDEESRLLGEAARQLERVGLGGRPWQPAGALALGEQRLLEVARALAADPLLVLLDEPAAGLRFGEKQALASLLRSLRDEGTTILLVEHDMQFLMGLADRVVVMDFGQKIAEGRPAEVQQHPAVIEAYLGAEAGVAA